MGFYSLREPSGVAEGVEEERAAPVSVAPCGDLFGEVGDPALDAAAEVEPDELAHGHDEPHRADPALAVEVGVAAQVLLARAEPPEQHDQRGAPRGAAAAGERRGGRVARGRVPLDEGVGVGRQEVEWHGDRRRAAGGYGERDRGGAGEAGPAAEWRRVARREGERGGHRDRYAPQRGVPVPRGGGRDGRGEDAGGGRRHGDVE